MASLTVGVLSIIPNLLKELRLKLPSVKLLELKSGCNDGLSKCEVILADYDLLAPILYDIPHIKFAHGTWAGIDVLLPHIKIDNLPKYPIIRYSGDHFGRIMSEYVIACIINHERDFFHAYENQKNKEWLHQGTIFHYRIISDLTIGILGIGNIGSRVGAALKSFGATIKGYGRKPSIDTDEINFLSEYFTKDQLNCFLTGCDYIINILPSTSDTRGLLNGETLKFCQEKQTVFINVGRGSIIADDDLINAIQNKWISAAFLDVFNTEPLPKDNLLWTLPQVRITPHVSAISRAKDLAEQFAINLQRFQQNEPLPTAIDFSRGY